MVYRIYADLKIGFSFVFLTIVVSLYMLLTYFYLHTDISTGSDVPIGHEVSYNNIFAIVHKQDSELTGQDNQILRCSQMTYGGNIRAGLNDVTALEFTPKVQFIPTQETRPCDKGIVSTNMELNIREYRHGLKCVDNFQEEYLISQNAIWAGDTHLIRQNHHSYLTRNSIVIEIGGNVGEDASAILRKYKPNAYVLLEPILPLYNQLKETFKKTRNMYIYNFGLGKKLSYFHVNMEGHKGETTSQFTGSNSGDCLIKVINATKFMLKLGVGCFDVDLLTINCEGCEFDVLESLISSSLIQRFKHVQFATHPTLGHLPSPITRYCEIIQILSRTHVPSYRYGFVWESWTRRDIIQKI